MGRRIEFAEGLKALALQGGIATLRKGKRVVPRSDPAGSVLVVLFGRVRVFVTDGRRREVALYDLGAGDYLDTRHVGGAAGPLSIVALEPSSIGSLPRGRLAAYLMDYPEVAVELVHELEQRARVLTERVASLAFVDVHARVLSALQLLAGGSQTVPKVAHEEIASRAATSPEMVDRVLQELAAVGHVTIDRGHITLLSPSAAEPVGEN